MTFSKICIINCTFSDGKISRLKKFKKLKINEEGGAV
mgnify:FL=1